MNINNLTIAEAYYAAMKEKNFVAVETYLHPEVYFITPLVALTGKQNVLNAIQGFASVFKTLTIRSKFSSADQVMLAYTVEFPAPIGNVSSTALMAFQDGLITKIELIYDARPFDTIKKDSLVDISSIKIMTILHRKLKLGKTYDDFFYAWLPPVCDQSGSRDQIKEQFIDYWRKNAGGLGGIGQNVVFHAKNLYDSSEIVSISLLDMSDEQFNKMMIKAAAVEDQRGDAVSEVADMVGDPKVYKLIETISIS